jgi:hypothetical protein
MNQDILEKIEEYLSNGGLFNPELMDHDKVRDLVIECRTEIEYARNYPFTYQVTNRVEQDDIKISMRFTKEFITDVPANSIQMISDEVAHILVDYTLREIKHRKEYRAGENV